MAATKGNIFGKDNHNAGRKPLWDNPAKMNDKIEEYFNGGCNHRLVIVGNSKEKREVKIPIITITGLAYYLGFESRQSFYDYENKEAFSYIIKRARLRIEQNYEELMQYESSIGSLFALKNMGWSDKQEIDHSSKDGTMTPQIIVSSERTKTEIEKLDE